jgi:diacylglycerol kinase (ATP)
MKNRPFLRRLGFALAGIRSAWRSEHSFKFQVVAAAGVLAVLPLLRPAPIWWAVVSLTVAAVIATELLNTALEFLVDRLHPDEHPTIKIVKDCAAGAVLVASCAALVVAAAFLYELLRA